MKTFIENTEIKNKKLGKAHFLKKIMMLVYYYVERETKLFLVHNSISRSCDLNLIRSLAAAPSLGLDLLFHLHSEQ